MIKRYEYLLSKLDEVGEVKVKEIKVKEVKVKEVKRNVNVDVVLKEPVLKRLELLSKKWASLWVKQHLLPVNL